MANDRVIIVHTLEQVVDALEVAKELKSSLILQSAPDAILYAGALYILHMFEEGRSLLPDVEAEYVIDCGETGAECVAAMQMGHTAIRSSAPPELLEKLADIAQQCDVRLHTAPYEALDLLSVRDTKAACKNWLKKESP